MLTVKKRINKRGKRMKGDYYSLGDFPGSPAVKISHFQCRAWVPSLVKELGPCMPCGMARRRKHYHSLDRGSDDRIGRKSRTIWEMFEYDRHLAISMRQSWRRTVVKCSNNPRFTPRVVGLKTVSYTWLGLFLNYVSSKYITLHFPDHGPFCTLFWNIMEHFFSLSQISHCPRVKQHL